jgi:outer membrane lipoprotein-sorting protein
MRLVNLAILFLACVIPVWSQVEAGELKTAAAVLDRYKEALGGVQAIANVKSMTAHGEAESTNRPGKATFVYYAKPFKSLFKLTRPDGTQISSGFDGKVGWLITPKGVTIDKHSDLEANLRDTDLQYPLHQSHYFKKLKLAGVTDFEGHRCYWLRGTSKWGRENNQFYDVETGLLDGWRFEADDASKTITSELFEDYKKIGDRLIATKTISHSGDHSQTFTYKSVSYEPLDDSIFELPPAVKALIK